MNWKSRPGGLTAFLVSILFLALGFLTLWFTKTMLNMQQDAVLVSILLIPILIYLILSGQLKEIRGPGGLTATFMAIAQTTLLAEEGSAEPVEVEEVGVVMKGGIEELQPMLERLEKSMYIVLTVTLGEHYDPTALMIYLRALSQNHNFKFLVVLYQNKEVFAYIPAWQAMQILGEETSRRFVGAITDQRKSELMRYGLVKTNVLTTDTNLKALKKMTDQKMGALIVVDEHGKLKGVVEREQVLSKLILAVTKSIQ